MADDNQHIKRVREGKRSRDVRIVKDGVLFIQHIPRQGGKGRGSVHLQWDCSEWGDFMISSIPPERIRILPEVSD